ARVQGHTAVAYLRFPLDVMEQRERLLKFTQLFARIGGIAVKVESAGVAHTFERWTELLTGTPFDLYCACVALVGGERYFYSCGMHHFGLPDSAAPRTLPVEEAAESMNQFNFWRISERPVLASGHTFSIT